MQWKWGQKLLAVLVAALLAGWTAPLAAQKAVVRGTVTDSSTGRQLEGALVSVLGTDRRAQVKSGGDYLIGGVTAGKVTLRVQMIGYASVEREIMVPDSGEVVANFSLAARAIELETIVAVGYGSTTRQNLTTAVSSMGGDGLSKTQASLGGGLQGKLPGVLVFQNSGTPGNGVSVRVRGAASISAGNQPLYVIDGVPLISENYGQLDLGGQDITGLTGVSSGDIESIDVLKDAASTAIYGSRGSNGVVMITTKRGKAGKAAVTLDAYTGPQWAARRVDMMNSTQYLNYFNEAAANDGYGPHIFGIPGMRDRYNTDWQDAVFQEAPIGSMDLAVGGGDEKLRYRISGNYFDQTGIVIGSGYRRLAGRMNLDFNTSDRLAINSSLAITGETDDRVENDNSISGILTDAIAAQPIFPVKKTNGSREYFETGTGKLKYPNPVALARLNSAQSRSTRILGNVEGRYRIGSGLGYTSRFGVDMIDVRETQYESPKITGTYPFSAGGVTKRDYSGGNRYVFDNFLNFDRDWGGRHSLALTGGNSIEYTKDELNFVRGEGLSNEKFTQVRNAKLIVSGDGTQSQTNLVSFFTRANYSFGEKYLLGGSIRTDGSSRFGPNNRWGVFPAVSAAWVLTKENFLREKRGLDELKLRASWGLTGNQPSAYYPYQGLVGSANYDTLVGLAPSNLANPDLKWESTSQVDLGLDLSLFKGRVYLTADWYNKNTRDLLLNRTVSATTGFTQAYGNVGNMTNKGFEFGLNTSNIESKDPQGFRWLTGLNLSFNRNKVTKLFDNQPLSGGDISQVRVGQPLGVFYTLKFLGVDPATGDAIFKDTNGDGTVDDDDRVVVGSPWPDYTGGLTNTFSWKRLDLSFLLTFSQGNKVYNAMRIYSAAGGYWVDNQFADQLSRWQKPGDITNVPRASFDGTSGADRESSRWVEDGSYWRMQDVTFGWQLPDAWAAGARFSSVRLYAAVHNLFLITDYTGYDPDVNTNGSGANISLATDFYTYPQARSVVLGIQAGW